MPPLIFTNQEQESHGTPYFQDISFSENLLFSLFYLFYFAVTKQLGKNHNQLIKRYTVKISWSLAQSQGTKQRSILAEESQ